MANFFKQNFMPENSLGFLVFVALRVPYKDFNLIECQIYLQ